MKKLKRSIIAAALSVIMLTSCSTTVQTESEAKGSSDASMFIIVESTLDWEIVYHREQK